MRYLLFLFTLTFAFQSYAVKPTDADYFPFIDVKYNVMKAPYPVSNAQALDSSIVTVSDAVVTRDTVTKLYDVPTWSCDSSDDGGYCQWQSKPIVKPMDVGNCEAKAWIWGNAELYSLKLRDASNDLKVMALGNYSGNPREVSLGTYPCSSGTKYIRLEQTTAGTAPQINAIIYYGQATNLMQVSQAQLLGTLRYAGTGGCIWSTQSTSYTNLSAQASCPTAVATGKVSAPGTKIPAVVVNDGPGKYVFEVTADTALSGSNDSAAYFRFSDGTNHGPGHVQYFNPTSVRGDVTQTLSLVVENTTGASITAQMQAMVANAANTAQVNNHLTPIVFEIRVYKYPLDSQLAMTVDSAGFNIDARYNTAANSDLGTSTVSSFTEITSSSGTLTPLVGSYPVGVACSGTNPSSDPSTSATTCAAGSESLGITFDIPEAGLYEACFYPTAYVNFNNSGGNLNFSVFETPGNAQTNLQGGSTSVSLTWSLTGATATSSPFASCETLDFASTGRKTVRLKYRQVIAVSPMHGYLFDGNASNYNTRITVRKSRRNVGVVLVKDTIKVRYSSNAGQSIPNAVETIINYGTMIEDSHRAVTIGASWRFTSPRDACYVLSARAHWQNTSATGTRNMGILKNGGNFGAYNRTPGSSTTVVGTQIPENFCLLKGDYISITGWQNSGGALALLNDTNSTVVSITSVD